MVEESVVILWNLIEVLRSDRQALDDAIESFNSPQEQLYWSGRIDATKEALESLAEAIKLADVKISPELEAALESVPNSDDVKL